MKYRKLPGTDIELSILGFGCMRLPVIDKRPHQVDYEKAMEMLRYGIDNGINFVDTAYFYHAEVFGQRGESEPFVGNALSNGYREKVYVATKLPLFSIKKYEQMDQFLNEQLERLKTDYVDFYLAHGVNGKMWDHVRDLGIREFFDKAKADGRIKNAAFSYHGTQDDFFRVCDEYNWTYAQIQYNYIDVDFQAGYKGLRYAADKGMGVVIMEPIKGGKLARNIPDNVMEIFDKASVKRKTSDWALQYIWNEPGVTSVLSGMSTMKHVLENLYSAEHGEAESFSEKDMQMFDALRKGFAEKNKADCTGCRYCMPCESGVNIPEIMDALNQAAVFNDKSSWASGYQLIEGKADLCAQCGACEEVCPQGLPVTELMKDAVDTFKSMF